ERVDLEKEALGNQFDKSTRPFWSWSLVDEFDRPNVQLLTNRVEELATELRRRIKDGVIPSSEEFELYDDLAHYVLYYRHIVDQIVDLGQQTISKPNWPRFRDEFEHWFLIGKVKSPSYAKAVHVFSYLYQLKRAFFHIFHYVIGRTWPIAKLRARIFESIFSHDLRNYRSALYRNMNEVTTLIVGQSGTGKELVARAIGLSQYLPFHAKTEKFAESDLEKFVALNLSAFSSSIIESELFGHEKGSYTGAESKRIGWLESVGRYGTVFLDEVGDLDLAIQVKLLRVLQNRQFQRIGESKTRSFHGKFIAATNRDLKTEMQSGEFREDFYYRICSDVIQTPSLRSQLNDSVEEFEFLVDFLARRISPEIADGLKADVLNWYEQSSMHDYDWPGNMRELEQCVRNIMIHNEYHPTIYHPSSRQSFEKQLSSVQLTAEQLLSHYCLLAYQKFGSYEKAATALGLDRRTVRAKCQLQKPASPGE
ncbi:MAG: sigma 54-interacting transcriptional regulator, partial [Planctomycetota bacterium]